MSGPVIPYERELLQQVLVYHWRTETSGCGCGWGKDPHDLGRSHSAHVLDVYEDSMAARAPARTTAPDGPPPVDTSAAPYEIHYPGCLRLRRVGRRYGRNIYERVEDAVCTCADSPYRALDQAPSSQDPPPVVP